MTARLHPGAVRHVWDHFVIGLRGPDGVSQLSLYAIAWSASLGRGTVAFLSLPDGTVRAWADRPGLGEAMQARLRSMGTTGPTVEVPVEPATVAREAGPPDAVGFRLSWPGGGLVARIEAPPPAVWVEGQAPAFWAEEDIWCAFLHSDTALLELDGRRIAGEPWLDDLWVSKVGRPLWSAHVALAEVRVEPVP